MSVAYVYIITDGEHVKIGMTSSSGGSRNRMKQLSTGSSRKLKLLYEAVCVDRAAAFELESALHKYYREYRIREENEWFTVPAKDVVKLIEFLETTKSALIVTADPTENYYLMNPSERGSKDITTINKPKPASKRKVVVNDKNKTSTRRTTSKTTSKARPASKRKVVVSDNKKTSTRTRKKNKGGFIKGFIDALK